MRRQYRLIRSNAPECSAATDCRASPTGAQGFEQMPDQCVAALGTRVILNATTVLEW